jgi:hypothetical protein
LAEIDLTYRRADKVPSIMTKSKSW